MLDLEAIEASIGELESADTTFVNCEKLASLYIVREHLQDGLKTEIDGITEELLPSYSKYREGKKREQLHELPENTCISELSQLCEELKELVLRLYTSTTAAERCILSDMLECLCGKCKK